MRRIVHLSDLHFGRTDPNLLEPLLEAVKGMTPDLVVISGDFTQRAREWQFAEAQKFIAAIPAPVLSVPGNHDTPLDNLFVRLLTPWSRYREYVGRDLEPVFRDDELAVIGVNTVNRFAWQQGRLRSRAIAKVGAAFADAGDRARIVVLHHPLEQLPASRKPIMPRAREALEGFSQAGAEIVLSGHIHSTHIAPFTYRPGLLFVQAGTVLSTRTRGEENSFNLLDLSPGRAEITAISVDDAGHFRNRRHAVFLRGADGWAPQGK